MSACDSVSTHFNPCGIRRLELQDIGGGSEQRGNFDLKVSTIPCADLELKTFYLNVCFMMNN